MNTIPKRPLNAMDTVADELLANMDGYERVRLAEELYNLIKQEPQKALDVLLEAIKDAKESCEYDNICPCCGEDLLFHQTRYEKDINASYGYKYCDNCAYSIEV